MIQFIKIRRGGDLGVQAGKEAACEKPPASPPVYYDMIALVNLGGPMRWNSP
jgi:hypothetical protein